MNTVITTNPIELDRLRTEVSKGELDFDTHRLLNELLPGWDAGVVADHEDSEELVLLNRLLQELVPAEVHVQLVGYRLTLDTCFPNARVAGWVEGDEEAMRTKLTQMLEKLSARKLAIQEA